MTTMKRPVIGRGSFQSHINPGVIDSQLWAVIYCTMGFIRKLWENTWIA